MTFRAAILATTCIFLSACGQPVSETVESEVAVSGEDRLMEQLIDAKPGDVIEIPEGTLNFSRGLSLTVDGVTIRGQGMDKTVLNFADQIAGAEGLLVTASDFTIEDLAIVDAKGDGLKINEGENITIRRVRAEWTGGPKTENGAYGIYPVQTTNVLIEDTVTIGASDAGLYVGQSKDVIVRRNRAEYNVAGIEIENTVNADVYENIATNNTGGILVFNMPQLQQEGKATRVFNNRVFANNTGNFGHPGTPVASVPAGTGIIVNSNDLVEIFDNEISDNQTGNIIVSSLHTTGYSEEQASASFDPYPEGIFIYG
ncbi:MAG: parallel beta-helix domain-containing protein, partial [Pseudomonadota bacterium]